MNSSGSTSIQNSFRFIQAGVALLLVFLVVEGYVLWTVCDKGSAATQGLQKEGLPSLQYLASLQENLAIYRLRSYELMFAQEQDRPAKSREADAVQQKNTEIIAALDKLYPEGEGRDHIKSLQASLTEYVQEMGRVRVMLDKDFAGAMKMLDQEIPSKVQRMNEEAGQVKAFCTKVAADHATMTVESFSRIRNFVLWLGSVSILFSALTVGMVAYSSVRVRKSLNSLVESLTFISESLVGSAGMVASSSQTLAQGSSTQAASIEETSASLEELSSMTKQNADNTQKANDLARQAREAADRGSADMQQMKLAMEEIKSSSDDVSKIIKTIDEIAFQTNILALNAAVEAARAGDAGMGFAVVADEVRNLAQRSANAAKETTAKIEGAISKTAQGVEISGKVEQTLNDIVSKARLLDDLAAGVATASREQTQGITQIGAAVGSMDSVTQTNAASAEASASAAEQLNSQAKSLKDAVVELQKLVGGTVATANRETVTQTQPAENEARAIGSVPKKRSGNSTSKNSPANDIPMPGDTQKRSELSLGTPKNGDFHDF